MNSKIETNIDSGYTFNFGKYISKGWKLLASNAGTFIVFVLILAVVSIVVNIILIIGIIASLLIITPAFAAGYYFLAREADVEGYTNLNTGFRGFNLLGKIIPVVLLKLLMLLASLIPFF